MLVWTLFFFVAFGTKVVLALLTIYLLLPNDDVCTRCDGETVPLRPSRSVRVAGWVFLGRVLRRWCPRCGWEGFARPVAPPREPAMNSNPIPRPRD